MATTTPNFGWSVPTSSDLVKNGATAIETLGDSIDASLVDLKGGTTGQVLSKASGTDMDFTWTAAATGSSNVAGKNLVLNSNYSIWQRGTSIAATGTGTTYGADRWQPYRNAAGGTMSRQVTGDTTNLPFIQYCARIARDSGNTSTTAILLDSAFESVNSIPYAGKTVTLSFYARAGANYSATSNALVATLLSGTGTDQNSLSGFTGASNVIQQTATLTTTWQRFSYSATVGTTATQLGVRFSFTPTGTAGAADYYEVTGVQVEAASSVTAYSPNAATYQQELAACQRYYERWSPETTNLAFAGFNNSTTNGYHTWHFHTKKRTSPTISISAAGDFAVRTPGNTNVTCSAFSTIGNTTDGIWMSTTVASGLVSGNGNFLVNTNANAYIQADSEL